jgi:hypothetical protein
MAAPAWRTPASGATVAGSEWFYQPISNGGGYWFCLSNASTSLTLRYAADPAGAWSTATLPAAPATYAVSAIDRDNGVVSDGTTFATAVVYSSGAARKSRILHATDPGGTWSSYEFDATDTYRPRALLYADGGWVMVGQDSSGNPFIGTASTVDDSWTFHTGSTATGYGSGYAMQAIGFDGTTWVTSAWDGLGNRSLRVSTSITSGWTTPTLPALDGIPDCITYHANGWWTCHVDQTQWLFTDDPDGTWSEFDVAQHGLDAYAPRIAWGADTWVLVGSSEGASYQEPYAVYLSSTGSPSGTYTASAPGWPTDSRDVYGTDVAFAGGYFVAASSLDADLRYATTAAPRLLRQRQSEKRTPSRVRGVDLRQRQTPFIR